MINILLIAILFSLLSCSVNKPKLTLKPTKIISLLQEEDHSDLNDLGNGYFEVTGKAFIQKITPEEARERKLFF